MAALEYLELCQHIAGTKYLWKDKTEKGKRSSETKR